jgi:hypothetical protein
MNIVILLAFLFAIAGAFIYLTTIYNGLVAIKNDIDKAWANIDVLLKQRHDELSKLLDVTKGLLASSVARCSAGGVLEISGGRLSSYLQDRRRPADHPRSAYRPSQRSLPMTSVPTSPLRWICVAFRPDRCFRRIRSQLVYAPGRQ